MDPAADYCVSHDPARAARLADSRRKGGYARSNAARARRRLAGAAMSVDELDGVVGEALRGVLDETTPPQVGKAVADLVRVALLVREATLLEDRLGALEAALAPAGPGGEHDR